MQHTTGVNHSQTVHSPRGTQVSHIIKNCEVCLQTWSHIWHMVNVMMDLTDPAMTIM